MNMKLNKTQLTTISDALKLLAQHGVTIDKKNNTATTKSKKTIAVTKKTVTATTKKVTVSPPKKSKKQNDIENEINNEVNNAVRWAKNNPYAYTWAELEQVMGKPTKLTQNQYNKLKTAIKADSTILSDIGIGIKAHKGIYKILELQRYLTVKFDLFISPYQCGTLLNQIFKLKNADIWFEMAA